MTIAGHQAIEGEGVRANEIIGIWTPILVHHFNPEHSQFWETDLHLEALV